MHPITARLWRGCTFLPLGWTCCPWGHLDCFSLQLRSISSNHTNIFQGVPSKPPKKTLNRHPLAIYLTPFGSSRYKHCKTVRNNFHLMICHLNYHGGPCVHLQIPSNSCVSTGFGAHSRYCQVTSILVVPLTLASCLAETTFDWGISRKFWTATQSQIYKMFVSKTLLDSKLILLHGKKTNTPPPHLPPSSFHPIVPLSLWDCVRQHTSQWQRHYPTLHL